MKSVIIYETKNGRRFDNEQEARDNERQTRYDDLLKRRLESVEIHPSTYHALIRFLMTCGEEIGEIANDPISAERNAAYTGGVVNNVLVRPWTLPKRPGGPSPIPDGVAFDPTTGDFCNADGKSMGTEFHLDWIGRANEFPVRRNRPGGKTVETLDHTDLNSGEVQKVVIPDAEPVNLPDDEVDLTAKLAAKLEADLKG